MKKLHIFKSGLQTAMSGQQINFTEADLAASVNAYNPSLHEAPIVIGHPKTDDPAYGWVESLSTSNGGLYALPKQVNPAFSEQVTSGAFKKISASFYPPNSPNNPVKGVYYLRHVGFLGAEPPAVKGLNPVEFSEADECVTLELDFSEPNTSALDDMSLIRRCFSALASVFGGADFSEQPALPDSDKPNTQLNTQPKPTNEPEPNDKETDMPDDKTTANQPTQAELDAANQRAADLQAKLDAKEAADAAEKAKAVEDANAEFAENLVNTKKLQPSDKPLVEAMLNALSNTPEPVNFGEGSESQPLVDVLKAKLSAAPANSVLFSEAATKPGSKTYAQTELPSGKAVDSHGLSQHQEILAYAEAHGVDYETAIDEMGV